MIPDLVLVVAFCGLLMVTLAIRVGVILVNYDPARMDEIASLCQLGMILILGYKVFW